MFFNYSFKQPIDVMNTPFPFHQASLPTLVIILKNTITGIFINIHYTLPIMPTLY